MAKGYVNGGPFLEARVEGARLTRIGDSRLAGREGPHSRSTRDAAIHPRRRARWGGTFEAKNALLRVQRAWNELDCALAEEWQVKIVNGSMVMVPFHDEGTHERNEMLQIMKKQMDT